MNALTSLRYVTNSGLTMVALVYPTIGYGEENPAKLAGTARFDLSAGASVGTLDGGQIIAGNGSIQRPNWVPDSQQPAAYTVSFPVSRLGCARLRSGSRRQAAGP